MATNNYLQLPLSNNSSHNRVQTNQYLRENGVIMNAVFDNYKQVDRDSQ